MIAATPFLISASLLLLGPYLALAIQSRLSEVLGKWMADGAIAFGPGMDRRSLARTSVWVVDASQIFANIVGPLVGLLVLKPGLGSALGILYVAAFVLAVAGFLGFTFLAQIDGYGVSRFPLVTPVGATGIVLNLIAAGVAVTIQP